ncbi:MAG: [citrate (pro-3S)-lyase] ligase [Candidatus Kariarchaeaceae archaeon]
MSFSNVIIQKLDYSNELEKEQVVNFLESLGLEFEEDVEQTIIVKEAFSKKIIGTGSIAANVLKCIGVDPDKQGEGISAKILTELVNIEYSLGRTHLFIFSSPKNIQGSSGNVFAGFKIVTQTEDIVLLEMGQTIEAFKERLLKLKKETTQKGSIGSIVVNCNPFTKGHLFLIEKAALECEVVYVIVVSEDKSVFPTSIREELVKKGVAHLKNVVVFQGENYVISPATFPRYFMKEYNDSVKSQTRLDVKLFAEHIVPTLEITRRYVGEEPYCPVTRSYNEAMQEILEEKGIEVIIIPRKMTDGGAISASTVRKMIHKGKLEEVEELVPPTTYEFLQSERKEAKKIIQKLEKSEKRH